MNPISPAPRRTVPWQPSDLRRLLASTTVGVVGVLVAWYQVSGEGRLASQVGWLDLAVASVVVLGAGNVGWFLSGRRALGDRRGALLARVASREFLETSGSAPEAPSGGVYSNGGVANPGGAEILVAVPGLSRFHRGGCPLTVGRSVETAPLPTHVAAGRAPCGICTP